ncbi:hypothetical protein ANO14919_020380 [Xylariales sp. No.14919]|nr:hypothetical protein ANO14919_020380 [Xylariales sp. No.14919]
MFARSALHTKALLRNTKLWTQLVPRSRQLPQARFSSTQASDDSRPTGSLNHKTFYKTFGRPIAKVFLMAIFTYQLVYYLWVRLEQDEVRAKMQTTISDLETRIEKLEQEKTQKKR